MSVTRLSGLARIVEGVRAQPRGRTLTAMGVLVAKAARPMSGAPITRAALTLLLVGLSPACVTVYQPLTALQRPVAIDPTHENFAGQRIKVRCIPGDALDEDEAEKLCRHQRALFEAQGAEVDTVVPREGVELTEAGAKPPDLTVDLKARLIHKDNSAALWVLSVATLTLVPAVVDMTFAQDVTIRDRDGFLLVADSLQARFVTQVGVLVGAANLLMDLLVRPPGQRLSTGAAQDDFSRDFYGQLSQLAFQARMRSWVMGGLDDARAPNR